MKKINIVSVHGVNWLRQFPKGVPEWGGWRFLFNEDRQDYDYLVVFDDIKPNFRIRCPREKTIHLATEPPAVRSYDRDRLDQYGWILTMHDDSFSHPNAFARPPCINWFIGHRKCADGREEHLSYEQLLDVFDKKKTKMLSIVCSNKIYPDGHKRRLKFSAELKDRYKDKIDFFGRGIRGMEDKIEALADYRFHIALENSALDHYFTETFTDPVMAGAYPIYYGCTNLDAYFPKNSCARIDIHDFDGAVETIDRAIDGAFDERFRDDLRRARDLSMTKYNLFPMIVDFIENTASDPSRRRKPRKADDRNHDEEVHGCEIAPFGKPSRLRPGILRRAVGKIVKPIQMNFWAWRMKMKMRMRGERL